MTLTAVVVLLVLAVTGATRWAPSAAVVTAGAGGTSAGVVPVSSTTLACPEASAPDATSTTDVTLVAPAIDAVPAASAAPPVGGASGTATATSLQPGTLPVLTLASRGPTALAAITSTDLGPVVVRTVGSLAPGLSATQLSAVGSGEVTGLAATGCTAPESDSWFLGLGTVLGHQPVLTVVNADEIVAEVDITLYGPDGPLELTGLRGVVVPAQASVVFPLDTLAPDLTALAAHVVALDGRVVAGVRDTRVEGLSSLGVDWVARSAAPSARVIVPGVRGGGGTRVLQLLAPGELDTLAQVRLLTNTGAIVPVGLEQVELTAGVVESVDLAEVVGADVVAVELTADQPLVAGLQAVTEGTGQREMSYTAGAAALTGPAILSDVRSGGGWTSRLMLTADDGGATEDSGDVPAVTPSQSPTSTPGAVPSGAAVDIQYLDAETGEVIATDRETISAGATVDLPLTLGTDDGSVNRFSVVVTPSSGVVYGALQLTLTGGPSAGVTELALFSPTLLVDVPYVRQDLSTGLRPRG